MMLRGKNRRKTIIPEIIPKNKIIPKNLFEKIQKSIPVATVDLLILRKNQGKNIETLLIKRKIYPGIGKWCLIGGRVLKNERLSGAIKRQAKKELGISISIISPWNIINPLGVFDDPYSDQKHFISITYPIKIKSGIPKSSGPEFSEAKWFPLRKLPPIGFGHKKQFRAFINAVKNFSLKIKI